MDITTATPREIDEKLADLNDKLRSAIAALATACDRAHDLLGEQRAADSRGRRKGPWPTGNDDILDRLSRIAYADPYGYQEAGRVKIMVMIGLHREQITCLQAEIQPLNAEYDRRRWTRFFTVEDGHIHRGHACRGGSIRPTTRLGWNPELSSKTEADAVQLLGPNLCTHCFPSAPVEWRASDKKKVAEGYCEGQGEYGENLQMQYVTPRGNCPICKQGTGISKTGKVLKHKIPTG